MNPERLSLIIATYNWPAALAVVLASVQRQTARPGQVVIADDGSRPDTAAMVESWRARLDCELAHVWQEDSGYRLARSRNLAIAAASGDYVVSIDGDMVLHPRFIADHADCARPDCFIQGSRVRLPPEVTQRMLQSCDPAVSAFIPGLDRRTYAMRSTLLSALTSRARTSITAIQGCNQSYWKQHLIQANGFDERFTTWGYEDSELAARLMHLGIKRNYVRHRAIAFHLHHASRLDLTTNPNRALLQETLAQRRTRAERGLADHMSERKMSG
jgi:glycosyltransferase involved in cell wall biosynthesis